MPLFQHRYEGHCHAGDIFVFSWWSESGSTIDASHAAAVAWAGDLWDGSPSGSGWASYTNPAVGIDRITTGEITVLTGQQQALRESPSVLVGTSASGSLPPVVSLVTSLRTATANRTGRGRFYLPQPATNALELDGNLAAAAQVDVADALEAAWTAAVGAGEAPVIYSRTARATRPVTSFNVGDVMDVQTRRSNSLTQGRVTRAMP